jgi:hypothetical protein
MGRYDRLIGIGLGIVLGLAIVAIFVFVFSEDTVDSPSIDETTTRTAQPADPESP